MLRALLPRLPGAHFLYLGDTARLPYGAKSQATIARYAVESARFLEAQGSQHLVIACNTATALALDDIRAAVKIPVTGVIEPVVVMSQRKAFLRLRHTHPRHRRPHQSTRTHTATTACAPGCIQPRKPVHFLFR